MHTNSPGPFSPPLPLRHVPPKRLRPVGPSQPVRRPHYPLRLAA